MQGTGWDDIAFSVKGVIGMENQKFGHGHGYGQRFTNL